MDTPGIMVDPEHVNVPMDGVEMKASINNLEDNHRVPEANDNRAYSEWARGQERSSEVGF